MSEMFGVLLALSVAVCFGISSTLQKYAISRIVTAKKKFSFKRMFTSVRWLFATCIGLVGIGAYVLAMRYAPLSTVQVFLSLSIVIPILAGFMFFKEKLRIGEWICMALIVVGIALTVL